MGDTSGPKQCLRADARRNQARILDAARAVISENGPEFAVNDVAIRAEVGLRTVYRRFARREDLISAVFERYVTDEVQPMVEAAVAHDDPWQALADGLETTVVSVAANSALLTAARDTALVTRATAEGFVKPLTRALERAQTAGVARTDLDATDFPSLIAMVVATMLAVPDLETAQPARWRRYLALLLEGCRASTAQKSLPEL
ncbi:TetR/AcrR family transcriptional regulator [Amycolatopsis sp. CA-126428]|uniref:TetR/AcrR family transcriptional regulator n=1 Tax=Amycolatopsis sp. CA-126428 TaxID=2073158 RepID=UPI001304E957|nr:TetR/AcrR family transcriptional regulator [Amycolatopsis sp. CA-126428]